MQETSQPRSLASGVYAALATPRRPGSVEVDTAALLDYADAIAAAGVQGIVLFGATGEFIHLETEERSRSAGLAIRRSRVPVLVNVSHSTLSGAIDMAESAIGSEAAGILLMPPYFYTYADSQILEFYRQFAEAIRDRIAIYLYNLPASTNPLSIAVAGKLFETGLFAGIKDSSGDSEYLDSLLRMRESVPFRLLAGHERLCASALAAGADGVVSGVAAAIPELVVALSRAIAAGEAERVRLLNSRLDDFLAFVNRFPATAIIRQAALLRGWNLKDSAVPFDDDLAAELIRFHSWFREWLPEVLQECAAKSVQSADVPSR